MNPVFDSDIAMAAAALFPKLFVEDMPEGRIMWCNRPLESIFGYVYGQLLGQPVEVLVPEEFREIHPKHRTTVTIEAFGELMAGGREVRGRKRDGQEIRVRIRLARATISGVAGVLAVVFDMAGRS